MLVIIMLEQRVVGVVGLEAASSRISMPSAKAPGACLGHDPRGTKGQQRSQADSRDLAMTSATLWSSSVHDGMPCMACKGSGVQIPSAPPQVRGPIRPRPSPDRPPRAANRQQPPLRRPVRRPPEGPPAVLAGVVSWSDLPDAITRCL
jgi:hypothetical protein